MIPTSKKAKFINPPNKLKTKVGNGGIPPERLKRAQEYINNNTVDFLPYAQNFLKSMQDFSKSAENDNIEQNNHTKLVESVMQLKAMGGMFRYQLITDVADICLTFIEALDDINNDARSVIKAHENTIAIIIKNKLTGSGGKEGAALTKELKKACDRYFTKYPLESDK